MNFSDMQSLVEWAMQDKRLKRLDWKRIDSHLGLHFSGAQAVSYKHFVEVTIPNILPSLSDEQMKNLENKIVDVTEKHRYELMKY